MGMFHTKVMIMGSYTIVLNTNSASGVYSVRYSCAVSHGGHYAYVFLQIVTYLCIVAALSD